MYRLGRQLVEVTAAFVAPDNDAIYTDEFPSDPALAAAT